MDWLNISVFVVALCFGLGQHVLDHDRAPIANSAPRWWTNGVLFATDTACVTIFAATLAWLTRIDPEAVLSPFALRDMPVLAQAALLLLIHSLVQYWVHRASHELPLLWRLHRVHHTDLQLDATTGLRHHPFESMLDYLGFLLVTLLLAPEAAAVLGYFLVSIAFALFTHFPVHWLPVQLDNALSTVIMTPRLHRLHHSAWHKETDTNYGNVLTFWDRLFGTYLPAPATDRAGFAIGLAEFPAHKAQDPFVMMASPFQRVAPQTAPSRDRTPNQR
jgi:sterol desaturase/sphingolipid hydroxylase (fatty acid hydroxylase superfamily)